jgi:hypothetical protein
MVKYCKQFDCIEFPNEGDYWLPIETFRQNYEDGTNNGYSHLLKKPWFKQYRKATQKILLDLGLDIDFKFNEKEYIEKSNSMIDMFNTFDSHVNTYGHTPLLTENDI